MNGSSLAKKVAAQFMKIPNVEAIALGGSQSSGMSDQHSDIDLYIYSQEGISIDKRQEIVDNLGASKADMNLTFWDTGDEWFDLATGIEVDVIYWSPIWIEEQLERVLVRHQASLGYTTCYWRTVKNSRILFDCDGWYAKLQEKCKKPYPAQLKRAIVAKNHPVLRNVIPSYYGQIKKALERKDLVSINHRLAALLASYFDVLFALNEVSNPGEKNLLGFVKDECWLMPENLEQQCANIFRSSVDGDMMLLNALDALLDGLDNFLKAEGFDPGRTLFAAQAT